jgi:HSP20 family protein
MLNQMKQKGDAEAEKDLISILSLDDPDFEDHLVKVDGELSVDVFQNDTHLVIVAPVAGVELDDLDISVNDNEVLTIKGKRSVFSKIKKEEYLTQECFWGAFSRSILLPEGLDVDQIRATFKRGVLKIELPKVKIEKHKKIKISD